MTEKKLSYLSQNVWKHRLMKTAAVSFNAAVRQMTAMFQWPKCRSKKMTEMSQRKKTQSQIRICGLTWAFSCPLAAGLKLVLRFLTLLLPCCASSLTIVWQCTVCSEVYFWKVLSASLPLRSLLVTYQFCWLLGRFYVFTLWNWGCSFERNNYSGFIKLWPDFDARLLWRLVCNHVTQAQVVCACCIYVLDVVCPELLTESLFCRCCEGLT